MPSTITTDIIRYNHPESTFVMRSHVVHPQSDITIICIVGSPKENVTSVVEDNLLETISSTEWNHGEEDADFSYITEKSNHFLSNLAMADDESVQIIFAIERSGRLMVASIGECEVILEEKNKDLSSIHEDTRGHHRFEMISSGEIPVGSTVFIVSKSIEGVLGDSFYADCAVHESATFADITKEVLARELAETVHLIRIRRKLEKIDGNKIRGKLQSNLLETWKEKILGLTEKVQKSDTWNDLREKGRKYVEEKNTLLLSIFLVIGMVIFLGLISTLIGSLFSVTSSTTKDAKNQIIEAKTLIESSQKLVSNATAFDATTREAEIIMNGLEVQGLYAKDIQELRSKIEAMKKEIYDIQTVSLDGKKSLIDFDASSHSPIGIYEKDKKITLIGEENVISDYAPGDTNLKIQSYPSGEKAKDYAVLEDGSFYILTESDRILGSRKNNTISYVSVTGQDGWGNSDGIETFNGNIYLWNKKDGTITKYRPGLNGFSTRSSVLTTPIPGIIDVGIDGGFYVLRDDQRITRVLTATNSQTGLILNKIPGEYTIGRNPSVKTSLIVKQDQNSLYVLDGNRIWMFAPDSKRFQDVRSWTYLAQIEIATPEEIRGINVVREGLIYILTSQGVYDINFEFVDDNILLRP